MKKVILASLICSASSLSYGDTILGIHAGVGQWNPDLSGEIGVDNDPITADELGFDDDSNNFLYAALEHPIPLLPNIRLTSYNVEVSGEGEITRQFTLADRTFEANEQTQSQLDVSYTDITLYYEILDNWVNFDIGLTARAFDGFAQVVSETQSERVDLNATVPMLYSRARFDLPFSGVYVGGAINLISSGDNKVTDIELYAGYEFDLPAIDLGVQVGLKDFSLEVEENDELNADVEIDGIYAAFTLHL